MVVVKILNPIVVQKLDIVIRFGLSQAYTFVILLP